MESRRTTNQYSTEDLRVMLDRMRMASQAFYALARQAGCHAFLEFAGLMNEYIKICEDECERGVDFTITNGHMGEALRLQPWNVAYLAEKLDCIYGPSLRRSPDLLAALAAGA